MMETGTTYLEKLTMMIEKSDNKRNIVVPRQEIEDIKNDFEEILDGTNNTLKVSYNHNAYYLFKY